MSDAKRKKWLMQESYFGHSWSHIFYKWKCSQIMLSKTTRRVLLNMPHKSRRVIDLCCGTIGYVFKVFDVCYDIQGVQLFGLDLNIKEVLLGARRSRVRV